MFDNLTGPIHTHGTTLVRIDGADHWVDSSMLTERAAPARRRTKRRGTTTRSGPVWSEPVDDLWRVWWTSAPTARRSAACCSTTT